VKIAIASDHAGFRYMEYLKASLSAGGYTVKDFGTHTETPVDYPIFVRPLAHAVATGLFDRCIVLGGSGNGEAIVANKLSGVRCAVCWNVESARLARQHNDANMLALGERLIAEADVWPIAET
jgi:ribose 5-phosphate isomerase B